MQVELKPLMGTFSFGFDFINNATWCYVGFYGKGCDHRDSNEFCEFLSHSHIVGNI